MTEETSPDSESDAQSPQPGADSTERPSETETETRAEATFEAPYPGSRQMPQWEVGELIDAPTFTRRNWFSMLGPGLLMGGAAIGGGEWLVGPIVTAKYGGAMLWLATLSILGQVLYNIEISRYTLYSGEPIFTGKFRILPGPMFWLFLYLLLDFGAVFPYLAANAATPLATVFKGGVVPDPDNVPFDYWLMKGLGYAIFLTAMIPLIFGGKIYNALKFLMTFKIVVVLGFLMILAVGYSKASTWKEICGGFFKFGTVPIRSVEDLNNNGKLDEGEEWDNDGNLDVMEPSLKLAFGSILRDAYATDIDQDGEPDNMTSISVSIDGKTREVPWPDLDEDGQPDTSVTIDMNGDGQPDGTYPVVRGKKGEVLYRHPGDKTDPPRLTAFIDKDGDGIRDGDRVANMFTSAEFPDIDWALVGFISALAAIAGSGGLSNTPVSNYTRDQGWGMGHHVGAIPSVVGGHDIQLSHVGSVFEVTEEALPRWRRWYRHVVRDQLVVWMPACFIGLALPSMLSVEYLQRGYEPPDQWTAAAMTAGGVEERVTAGRPEDLLAGLLGGGDMLGNVFWFMTLFCGFLVLAPSMASSADGIVRRWVDVFWTGSKSLRKMDPKKIRSVYFYVLAGYAVFGMIMLSVTKPVTLMQYATVIFNFALGFSCWHSLVVNLVLLPRKLRPNWFIRIGMFAAGSFFTMLAVFATMKIFGMLGA